MMSERYSFAFAQWAEARKFGTSQPETSEKNLVLWVTLSPLRLLTF
jgi:hypothetical protein